MVIDNLYDEVLIKPLHYGANQLYIISNYAAATMASKHIKDISDMKIKSVAINIIIGMCQVDGVYTKDHEGFNELVENKLGIGFQCSYVYRAYVGSNIYIWCKNNKPLIAFTGSVNYTQSTFYSNQREMMVECDPLEAMECYNNICKDTIFCNHIDINDYVLIKHDKNFHVNDMDMPLYESLNQCKDSEVSNNPSVITVSLLAKNNEVGKRSGLNWGQRPGREPNQAYIPLTSKIYRSNFFPPRKIHFTVITDDGKSLICTRAQDNEKAIETPHNNSLLGEYFRNRLGVANGCFITKADLERYGRTNVTFEKIDEETYYMDFSV